MSESKSDTVNASIPGNVIFRAGRGGTITGEGCLAKLSDGDIIFEDPEGREVLRLGAGGKVSVRGVIVAEEFECYVAFRAWLAQASSAYQRHDLVLQTR